jgi:hypothetical protein
MPPTQWVAWTNYMGVKRLLREDKHSNVAPRLHLELCLHRHCMTWCLIKHRDNFTFIIILKHFTRVYLHLEIYPYFWGLKSVGQQLQISKNMRRIQRDAINVHKSSCKLLVIHVKILIRLGFSLHIVEKASNTKFHENPSSGIRVAPCGWTERQTWRNQ